MVARAAAQATSNSWSWASPVNLRRSGTCTRMATRPWRISQWVMKWPWLSDGAPDDFAFVKNSSRIC